MRNLLIRILVGFPRIVLSAVKQHPYLSLSMVIHLMAITTYSYFGIYKIAEENHNKRVQTYLHNSEKAAIERSIKSGLQDLEEMETLMAHSISEEQLKEDKDLAELVKKVSNKQNLKSDQPQDRLEKAKQMADNITTMEQSLRAKDLEKAMSISHDEAVKRVVQADSTEAKTAPDVSPAKVIELLEKKAGEALQRREKQLNREQIGIPVSFFDEQNFQFNTRGNGMDGANGSDSGNVYAELPALQKIKSHISDTIEHVEFKRNDYVDVWLNGIPPVDSKKPQKQMGRVIGDSGTFVDRLFINSWYIIGPFFDRAVKHPPEYEIDLDAEYLGKNQQFIKWQYVHDGRYPLIPPQEDKQGIFYGYTEVTLYREQDLWVWIGADDFASVWLNEHALWESDSFNWKFNGLVYDHDKTEWNNWNLTEYKRRVHFKKGINKFFFKLTNIQGGIFFSLILTK